MRRATVLLLALLAATSGGCSRLSEAENVLADHEILASYKIEGQTLFLYNVGGKSFEVRVDKVEMRQSNIADYPEGRTYFSAKGKTVTTGAIVPGYVDTSVASSVVIFVPTDQDKLQWERVLNRALGQPLAPPK